MGHHLGDGRGPWAEGAPPFRASRTTSLGRVEPLERRAPTYQEALEQQVTPLPLCVGRLYYTLNTMNVLILI